jgi:hypothetical protein
MSWAQASTMGAMAAQAAPVPWAARVAMAAIAVTHTAARVAQAVRARLSAETAEAVAIVLRPHKAAAMVETAAMAAAWVAQAARAATLTLAA